MYNCDQSNAILNSGEHLLLHPSSCCYYTTHTTMLIVSKDVLWLTKTIFSFIKSPQALYIVQTN